MTTTDNRIGHPTIATHAGTADPVSSNRTSQSGGDSHSAFAGAVSSNRLGHPVDDNHPRTAEPVVTSLRANGNTATRNGSPAGTHLPADHEGRDTHKGTVGGSTLPTVQRTVDTPTTSDGGNNSSPLATDGSTPITDALEGNQTEDGIGDANEHPLPRGSLLADPFLALAADVLDDTERTKIANENRLRQLTRTAVDSDGEERGFGLDESHPDVANLAALVDLLAKVEHQAVLQLQRKMRKHPLGPWIKSQKGVGDKQAARLLAVIGDPYWNDLHDRPRTVSELWAYSGLHVIPASQRDPDTQSCPAGGDSSPAGGDSSQGSCDSQATAAGVAARRQKGQKANWSTLAKTRAYLIAESMLRSGNREVYDARKVATEGRLHAAPCVRCGPKGKPALAGSPWSDGHRHADALRIVSKDLLKNLWREAKRIHEDQH